MEHAIFGPHQEFVTDSKRERFAIQLFDRLWMRYRSRVEFVRVYEKLVNEARATFFNDHIAFRTFANQNPMTGISSLSRMFEALGYRGVECYQFEDKHLGAIYFQHPHPKFPKIFISELRTWELSRRSQQIIQSVLSSLHDYPSMELLAGLNRLDDASEQETQELFQQVKANFLKLPWNLPDREDVLELNKESQYGAWVLVHGYQVNHFTSLINSHGPGPLSDIEKTSEALRRAGVPMKSTIEGARGSKLRQTTTEAVMVNVPVMEKGKQVSLPWTYAYFELAQRDPHRDPVTGEEHRYEGFLGPQATNLFEMTRVR